ncbi:hypothetical protein [Natrarchaeobaculum sulfurireducens]|nr:hypothetical protein [Natrarchaeobaculum sulfurireducens]
MSRNRAIEPATPSTTEFTDLLAEHGTAVIAGFLTRDRHENFEGMPRLEE